MTSYVYFIFLKSMSDYKPRMKKYANKHICKEWAGGS